MIQDERMRHNIRRYGFAVLSFAATLAIVLVLAMILPFEPFLLFAIPVALTSRYAGRAPTAVTVILSVLAIESILRVSRERFTFTGAEIWVHAAIFGVVAWVIDSCTEAMRNARRDAERAAKHREDLNVELEQQMEQIQLLSDDLQRTNVSLAAARDAAQEASRAREEMLGIVAHDLRNPLSLVMGTTQLFAETQPTGERRDQLLGIIQRAAQRMNRLIGDLMEVVRQESGQMVLDVAEVRVSYVLAQTAEMFHGSAMERGIALRVEDCPSDLSVWADSERIMQVMSNLVGNALKFVPSGGRIVLECASKGSEAIFAVSDSGPGIAPDDLGKLFEKFWQRRRTDRRGVGLGLSIARGIVEAHGGHIWAGSTVGAGSTFFFTLPAVMHPYHAPSQSEHMAAATA